MYKLSRRVIATQSVLVQSEQNIDPRRLFEVIPPGAWTVEEVDAEAFSQTIEQQITLGVFCRECLPSMRFKFKSQCKLIEKRTKSDNCSNPGCGRKGVTELVGHTVVVNIQCK